MPMHPLFRMASSTISLMVQTRRGAAMRPDAEGRTAPTRVPAPCSNRQLLHHVDLLRQEECGSPFASHQS
jgi:hypothetical protein